MQKNWVVFFFFKLLRNIPFISAEFYFLIWVPEKDIHMISLISP